MTSFFYTSATVTTRKTTSFLYFRLGLFEDGTGAVLANHVVDDLLVFLLWCQEVNVSARFTSTLFVVFHRVP
jgi:hypothetical protein